VGNPHQGAFSFQVFRDVSRFASGEKQLDSAGQPVSHDSDKVSRFAALCEQLAQTGGKLEKRARIAGYLRSLDAGDAALAALYLTGSAFSAKDTRQLNVGGAILSRVLEQLSGASRQGMHAAYLRHGDLGAAAFDLLEQRHEARAIAPTLTLKALEAAFAGLAPAKPGAKQRLLVDLLARATPSEAKYLIKIILGDMRIGVKESMVEEAIAAAYSVEIAGVRRAMMLNGSLPEVVKLAANHLLAEAGMKLFHPLGFMLASPVATVEEALQRFAIEVAAEGERVSADVFTEAQLEDKYDGIRAQLHCGDPEQPGRVAIFSRTRDELTASFPEFVEAFARIPQPLILDGEILAWDRFRENPASEDFGSSRLSSGRLPGPQPEAMTGSALHVGRALPFAALQPRLGRKKLTEEMRAAIPVIFMAFDLLYFDGELMLERPLAERREKLEDLVRREQPGTTIGSRDPAGAFKGQSSLQFDAPVEDAFPRLLVAPAVRLRNVDHLEQAYVDARARGNEGVMIKARHSAYQPGRRGLSWLKLKRELATLDVVVTMAEYGHGKRAGLLSDYTFAVRAGGKLKNIGKAYSGLTDSEIATLTAFFQEHTVEDFGFARSVEPRIVLEVAFNNVMRSSRHDSGFALRFPRIVRIRNDKPVNEIDTLECVEEIYRSQDLAPHLDR
jgi:DNA ligase 1